MPSPEKCAARFKKDSQAYKDCIAYKNQSPVKGRTRKPSPSKGY